MSGEERWCVVTGGRGFAARHLVVMLIKYGIFSVRVADLGPTIKLDADEENGVLGEALKSGRAQYVSADLRDKSQVLKGLISALAFQPRSLLHYLKTMTDKVGIAHKADLKMRFRVCLFGICCHRSMELKLYFIWLLLIPPLTTIICIILSMYKHNDFYSATKAEGEALVIKSNGSDGLRTCCIRPSSIFGPGDKLLVPSLVAAARAGKSKFIIGDGNNMYDFTYVENVAHAHICAERALASDGMTAEKAAGQAYFMTNMEPIKFWEFMSLILEGLGYERPKTKIPAFVVMPIAHMEGLRRTIESYPHLRGDVRTRRDGPSKSELILGRGKVTAVSNLLLMALVFLLIHGKLPQKILGYKIEKIPESRFHVSEAASHHFALSVASWWNSVVSDLKSLCNGNDFMLFLKVVLSLLFLSILGAVSLRSAFVIVTSSSRSAEQGGVFADTISSVGFGQGREHVYSNIGSALDTSKTGDSQWSDGELMFASSTNA
ncbi:3beta-hydroxysteroid-dehydrogenase/decarboxylase isoform 2 [Sesamum angolense]|uniref:3beta-hydroxysteroid-dehydrogenase/decarboxylase isoform 2 n=1 Tax=Sesamum angolense TaxID=2727404 RepID=A0AAE2BKQ1_9LAMI|nr:3beta-hydroxysteroid-dehydrogenase/decarboxylase isoform 2 [Sesamum angolense]